MDTRIDHFMYAVPSLDEGMAWARDTFGVEPAYGGAHVGLGTCNALLSLGTNYLEIIAPDPAQDFAGTLGEKFANLSTGGMVTWAAEGDLNAIAAMLQDLGMQTLGPNRTERKTADDDLLVWDLLFPLGSSEDGRMPFFIDWLACANPRDTNPVAGEFRALTIASPTAEDLAAKLTSIGLELAIENGRPAITVAIDTPRGPVELMSTEETARIRMR
ncbi:MAG: VOC family protein [Pseudomonadota bacterium]